MIAFYEGDRWYNATLSELWFLWMPLFLSVFVFFITIFFSSSYTSFLVSFVEEFFPGASFVYLNSEFFRDQCLKQNSDWRGSLGILIFDLSWKYLSFESLYWLNIFNKKIRSCSAACILGSVLTLKSSQILVFSERLVVLADVLSKLLLFFNIFCIAIFSQYLQRKWNLRLFFLLFLTK